jgi:hypothetical protein
VITGWYVDVNVLRGFVRAADGTITKFDVPGAAYATSPTSINPSGVITGDYFDASGVARGFVRAKGGTITTFDVAAPFFGDNTFPESINPSGAIAGWYSDERGTYHGFLREPCD